MAAFSSGLAQETREAPEYTQMRRYLAEAIEYSVNIARYLSGEPAIDPRVIAAMAKVPRHEFVPAELREYAYLDRPLPVAPDATVSQPSLVAVMTDLLKINPGEKVLEVGIGGGYHTAILAELTPQVFSVEYHAGIAETAKNTLERLGYGNVRIHVSDGFYGWGAQSPYDAILVRMAISEVSAALFDQLKTGGRMIAPVGPADAPQELTLYRKSADGRVSKTVVMPVFFRALPGGIRL
jgi:protein-L-isoaspartate(D-aspartate) O-methyltransferase